MEIAMGLGSADMLVFGMVVKWDSRKAGLWERKLA